MNQRSTAKISVNMKTIELKVIVNLRLCLSRSRFLSLSPSLELCLHLLSVVCAWMCRYGRHQNIQFIHVQCVKIAQKRMQLILCQSTKLHGN